MKLRAAAVAMMGVSCFLLAAVAAPTGRGAEEQPEKKQDVEKKLGPPEEELERGWKKMRRKQRRRLRQQESARLERYREILSIESDRRWEALRPDIAAVDRLRRALHRIEESGWMAIRLAGQTPENPPYPRTRRLHALLLPSIRTDVEQVRSLLDARLALASRFRDPKATREQLEEARHRYRGARRALEQQIESHRRNLRKSASPRQQAGLTLLGVLE